MPPKGQGLRGSGTFYQKLELRKKTEGKIYSPRTKRDKDKRERNDVSVWRGASFWKSLVMHRLIDLCFEVLNTSSAEGRDDEVDVSKA